MLEVEERQAAKRRAEEERKAEEEKQASYGLHMSSFIACVCVYITYTCICICTYIYIYMYIIYLLVVNVFRFSRRMYIFICIDSCVYSSVVIQFGKS